MVEVVFGCEDLRRPAEVPGHAVPGVGSVASGLFGAGDPESGERRLIGGEIGLVEFSQRPLPAAGVAKEADQMMPVVTVADEPEQGLGFGREVGGERVGTRAHGVSFSRERLQAYDPICKRIVCDEVSGRFDY